MIKACFEACISANALVQGSRHVLNYKDGSHKSEVTAEGEGQGSNADQDFVCDKDIEEAFRILEAERDRISVVDEVHVTDFCVAVQGGALSVKKHGRACDSFKGRVRFGSAASEWCDKYLGFQTAQYDAQMYGDQNASVLAREWCRRLQYFWNVHQNSSDPHHVFSAEDIAAYRPLPEFTEVLAGLQGRALRRAWELAALVPCERH